MGVVEIGHDMDENDETGDDDGEGGEVDVGESIREVDTLY